MLLPGATVGGLTCGKGAAVPFAFCCQLVTLN